MNDRCSKTSKKQFNTISDATLYQNVMFPNRSYRVYLCHHCQYYHVTTEKASSYKRKVILASIKLNAAHLIQFGQSIPIQSLSNTYKVHEVRIGKQTFEVVYNKSKKIVTKILTRNKKPVLTN